MILLKLKNNKKLNFSHLSVNKSTTIGNCDESLFKMYIFLKNPCINVSKEFALCLHNWEKWNTFFLFKNPFESWNEMWWNERIKSD